mgnify:FL=1
MENKYKVVIAEVTEGKELNFRERARLVKLAGEKKIDKELALSEDKKLTIKPDYYAILEVHNPSAENEDYTILCFVCGEELYTSSSETLKDSYLELLELAKESNESLDFPIEIYGLPSKNYSGREFFTCTIA